MNGKIGLKIVESNVLLDVFELHFGCFIEIIQQSQEIQSLEPHSLDKDRSKVKCQRSTFKEEKYKTLGVKERFKHCTSSSYLDFSSVNINKFAQ